MSNGTITYLYGRLVQPTVHVQHSSQPPADVTLALQAMEVPRRAPRPDISSRPSNERPAATWLRASTACCSTWRQTGSPACPGRAFLGFLLHLFLMSVSRCAHARLQASAWPALVGTLD